MERDDSIKQAMETLNHAEADYGFSIWIGTIFFYFLRLGKVPFENLHQKQYNTRNALVGWLLRVMVIIAFIYIIWYFHLY